jgi:AcrR family transcriptional regulator
MWWRSTKSCADNTNAFSDDRLFPTKDALIGAYLARLAASILAAIDHDVACHADDPRRAVEAMLDAIAADPARPAFAAARSTTRASSSPTLRILPARPPASTGPRCATG